MHVPLSVLFLASTLIIFNVDAGYDWTTGKCSDASQVYSQLQQSCILNPCSSSNVFNSGTETCECPSPTIIDPPGTLPSKTGVTCTNCATSSQMKSLTYPPTCLPCAESVITTPPSVAFRNLFIQGSATTVAINGSTWVYGGGNIFNADGSVSQDRVAIAAAKWSSTYSSCACPSGFILTNTLGDGVNIKAFICARCTNFSNALSGGPASIFSCNICTGGSTYDPITMTCTCSASSSYLVKRDGALGGDYCASAALQSSVLSSGSSGSTTSTPVNLNNGGSNGPSVESYAMSTAVSSALGCAAKNATSCQVLSNLCVLSLYDPANAACVMYLRLVRAEGCSGIDACERPKTVPWLSYLRSSAAVFQQTTINMRIALRNNNDGTIYDMVFVLFEYDVFGNLVSRRRLVDELCSCNINSALAKNFFLVGRKNYVNCNIEIQHFIQKALLLSHPTSIYELFLQDSDGTLIPVPVILDSSRTDFVYPQSVDDDLISRSSSVDQNPRPEAWRRRFFMVDNYAGRTSATSAPSHVTYARNVAVMIHLRSQGSSTIFVPVVYIQYASSMTADLLKDTALFNSGVLTNVVTSLDENPGAAPRFEYRVYFIKSDDDVVSAVKPTVIVLCVMIIFTSFARTFFWSRRQQDGGNITMTSLVRWFIFLCNHFANMFAVFCYLCCGVFYIFYKGQSTGVEWLLPNTFDYVWGFLYSAFACKMLVVIYYILEQCNADYFVIDWERPKNHPVVEDNNTNNNINNGNSSQGQQQQQQDSSTSGVSMWRSTFIANELNEMQTRRSFHVLFVILLVLVFTEGAGYINLARAVPNADLTSAGAGPWAEESSILRIAVGLFFWIIISLVFYVIELVYYSFISPHPLQAFADLCAVSNISIVILLEPMWGFYIHGESLHSFSDVSVEEFQTNLQRESKGLLPPRGLGGIPNCQTFEVFVGSYLRNFLYICYGHLYGEIGKAVTVGVDGAPIDARHHKKITDYLFGRAGNPLVFTPQTLSIKRQINNAFQQSVRSSQKFEVKQTLHALADVPPNIMYMNGPFAGDKQGIDLFFADSPTNYSQAFMSGLDFDMFILYGLLYATMDSTLGNTFWPMITIYLMDVVLVWFRGKQGTANLGSKTLFDERFFL